ncbi:hypothetical protein ACU6U9_09175 [Pseudomonas sp. HK3]
MHTVMEYAMADMKHSITFTLNKHITMVGTRAFSRLVPTTPDDPASQANLDAWHILEKWDKPFLTLFSNGDPIMRGFDKEFQRRVPGCKNMPHQTLKGGHFLQEDSGTEFALAINDLLAKHL